LPRLPQRAIERLVLRRLTNACSAQALEQHRAPCRPARAGNVPDLDDNCRRHAAGPSGPGSPQWMSLAHDHDPRPRAAASSRGAQSFSRADRRETSGVESRLVPNGENTQVFSPETPLGRSSATVGGLSISPLGRAPAPPPHPPPRADTLPGIFCLLGAAGQLWPPFMSGASGDRRRTAGSGFVCEPPAPAAPARFRRL